MINGTGTMLQSLLALMSSNASSSSFFAAISLFLFSIYFSVYVVAGYSSPSFFSVSFFNSFGITILGLGNIMGFCLVEVTQSKTILSLY
jgi:hypothetical protein